MSLPLTLILLTLLFFTSSFWVLNSQQNRVQKTTKELEGVIGEVWISRVPIPLVSQGL